MRKKVEIDDKLDKEIKTIQLAWKSAGFSNVTRPDVLRVLIKRYKDDDLMYPRRKRKKTEWEL